MSYVAWNPPAGAMSPGQHPPPPASMPEPRSPVVNVRSVYDGASFAAGQDCGTRVAACVARLAALELTDHSRWWNRRRHRLMAGALVACAEELECAADADGRRDAAEGEGDGDAPAHALAAGAGGSCFLQQVPQRVAARMPMLPQKRHAWSSGGGPSAR